MVLTIVQMLREKGVVGKFVEFYGEGLKNLTLLIGRLSQTWRQSMELPVVFFLSMKKQKYLKFSVRNFNFISRKIF